MADLERRQQRGSGRNAGLDPNSDGEGQERNRREEFGTAERSTRGKNKDFDETGESRNQGHGHPREERED